MLMVSKTQQRNERKISAWLLEEDPSPPVDEGPLRPRLQNQIVACIICNLGAFSFGTAMGWSSPVLPELKNTKELTEGQAAWAGGIIALGAMVSLPIFGYMARTKGRKPAAYVVGVPLAIGFYLKTYEDFPLVLLIGRFLCGLGGGGALSLPPLYIGEICESRVRGFLSSLMMVEFSLGLLTVYLLGALLPDIHTLPFTLIPIPLTFLLAFWFMPETPLYRLRLGQEEEAARALAWLRKLPLNSKEVKDELTQMAFRLGLKLPLPLCPPKSYRVAKRQPRYHSYLRSPSRIASKKASIEREIGKQRARQVVKIISKDYNESPVISWKTLMSSKAGVRGLMLCFFLVTSQTFMGLMAVSFYALFIFEKSESAISPNSCAILYASVVVLGSIFGSLLMDRAGRRMLQITSCVVVCICHLTMGTSLKAIANDVDIVWLKWLPLIALLICVFAYTMGAGAIPMVIISEIFAPEVRDIATNVLMMYLWVTCFLLLQFFPHFVKAFGLDVVFYCFAVVSLSAAIFNYYFLIETKEKNLEDILKQLSGDAPENSNSDVCKIEINVETKSMLDKS